MSPGSGGRDEAKLRGRARKPSNDRNPGNRCGADRQATQWHRSGTHCRWALAMRTPRAERIPRAAVGLRPRIHVLGKVVARDFCMAVKATFRLLSVIGVIHHGSRGLLHLNVTPHPTGAWTFQQLRACSTIEIASSPNTWTSLLGTSGCKFRELSTGVREIRVEWPPSPVFAGA